MQCLPVRSRLLHVIWHLQSIFFPRTYIDLFLNIWVRRLIQFILTKFLEQEISECGTAVLAMWFLLGVSGSLGTGHGGVAANTTCKEVVGITRAINDCRVCVHHPDVLICFANRVFVAETELCSQGVPCQHLFGSDYGCVHRIIE